MKKMINVADMVDSNDPQGRTYREINNEEKHNLKVGDFVKVSIGDNPDCFGTIEKLSRDCDGTPLYSISVVHYGFAEEDIELVNIKD